MKKKNEYHPPMTGLEAHMEEEITREANRARPARVVIQPPGKGTEKGRAEEIEAAVEQAMHLGQ